MTEPVILRMVTALTLALATILAFGIHGFGRCFVVGAVSGFLLQAAWRD